VLLVEVNTESLSFLVFLVVSIVEALLFDFFRPKRRVAIWASTGNTAPMSTVVM